MTVIRLLALALGAMISGACAVAGPSPTPAEACASTVANAVLPAWARAGFTDEEPSVAHSIGRSGAIAAIVFGATLYAPPKQDQGNKILWVARDRVDAPGPLTISAQRMDGRTPVGDPVRLSVPDGPGPSTIDLPVAGCWRLALGWGDRSDSLDLEYVPPPGAELATSRPDRSS
jgi:hypothetical protein